MLQSKTTLPHLHEGIPEGAFLNKARRRRRRRYRADLLAHGGTSISCGRETSRCILWLSPSFSTCSSLPAAPSSPSHV